MGIARVNTLRFDSFYKFNPPTKFPIGWQMLTDWAEDVVYSNDGIWLKMNGQKIAPEMYPELIGTSAVIITNVIGTEKTVLMTSNTAPAGYEASASSLYAGAIYSAMSTGKAPGWYGKFPFVSDGSMSEWIQIKVPEMFVCGKYEFKSSDEYGCTPKDFTLSGSNDGIKFVMLDTQVGVPTPSGKDIWLSFAIDTLECFSYYRLSITKLGSTGICYYPRIAGFRLYESAVVVVTVKNIPDVNGQCTYIKASEV